MTLYLSLKAVAYAERLMEKEASPMITRHNFSCRTAALGGVAVAALLLGACANDVVQSNLTAPPAATSEASNYASLIRVADAMRASGDTVSAVGLYKRASTIKPMESEPLAKLGYALLDLKAYNEAAASFRSALSNNPNDAEAMRGLGNALLSLNQPQVALKQYESALALEPNDARTYNSIGVVLDSIGDHRAAQARYRQGLNIAGDSLSLRNNLGLSLALSGDYKDAIATLRPVAANPGATVRNRQNLALVYGLSGDLETAARVARMDLDEAAVRSNLAYYSVLRELADQPRVSAIGANPARMEIMGLGRTEPLR
jgi:Flp pilus assembly protein TadD